MVTDANIVAVAKELALVVPDLEGVAWDHLYVNEKWELMERAYYILKLVEAF